MKLFWKLHETSELYSDLSLEDAAKAMRSSVGMQFHGGEAKEGWELSHNDRNFFRPSLQVTFQPDGEGTLILAEYRLDKTLLIFMCVWSALVLVMAILKNVLLLGTLLLFWGAVLVGFSLGVKQSNQDLTALFSAYEIEG